MSNFWSATIRLLVRITSGRDIIVRAKYATANPRPPTLAQAVIAQQNARDSANARFRRAANRIMGGVCCVRVCGFIAHSIVVMRTETRDAGAVPGYIRLPGLSTSAWVRLPKRR